MRKQISTLIDGERVWSTVDMTQAEIDDALPPPASTNPRDYTLTKPLWRHMARAAGFWTHIKTVEEHLEVNDHAAYADLMETLEGNQFKFDATLAQITSFAPLLPDVELPDETALSALWIAAAARRRDNQ